MSFEELTASQVIAVLIHSEKVMLDRNTDGYTDCIINIHYKLADRIIVLLTQLGDITEVSK
jgi:hypothetical protein